MSAELILRESGEGVRNLLHEIARGEVRVREEPTGEAGERA